VDDPHGDDLAADLAGVVAALRAAPAPDVPRREAGQRGGPLHGVLDRVERWLGGAEGPLPTSTWCPPGRCSGGAHARPSGSAWRPTTRPGCGPANALEQALGAIAYYTPRRHPLSVVMVRTLHRVLDDVAARSR
jgi:hypothetical protein